MDKSEAELFNDGHQSVTAHDAQDAAHDEFDFLEIFFRDRISTDSLIDRACCDRHGGCYDSYFLDFNTFFLRIIRNIVFALAQLFVSDRLVETRNALADVEKLAQFL